MESESEAEGSDGEEQSVELEAEGTKGAEEITIRHTFFTVGPKAGGQTKSCIVAFVSASHVKEGFVESVVLERLSTDLLEQQVAGVAGETDQVTEGLKNVDAGGAGETDQVSVLSEVKPKSCSAGMDVRTKRLPSEL